MSQAKRSDGEFLITIDAKIAAPIVPCYGGACGSFLAYDTVPPAAFVRVDYWTIVALDHLFGIDIFRCGDLSNMPSRNGGTFVDSRTLEYNTTRRKEGKVVNEPYEFSMSHLTMMWPEGTRN